jgi:hypothetical protein
MIHELLKQWAELESDRCRFQGDECQVLWRDEQTELWTAIHHLTLSADRFHALGLVQDAVQKTIVAQNLRYHLENDKDRHYASLMAADGSGYCRAEDEEPAIALLQAYVQWLEKEVAA